MTKLGWAAWLLIFIFIGAASRTPAQVIPFTSTRWDTAAGRSYSVLPETSEM